MEHTFNSAHLFGLKDAFGSPIHYALENCTHVTQV